MEPLCGVQMRDKGVIVWEGWKCHTDWHCHSQHQIPPYSCSKNSLCPKGPVLDMIRRSRVYLKVAKDRKVEKRMCSQEKRSSISIILL